MSQQEYAFLNGDSRICNKEKEDIIISCLSNKLAGNAKAPINIGVPWGKVYRRESVSYTHLDVYKRQMADYQMQEMPV